MAKCTCGNSSVGSNRHSDWCDVVTEKNNEQKNVVLKESQNDWTVLYERSPIDWIALTKDGIMHTSTDGVHWIVSPSQRYTSGQ